MATQVSPPQQARSRATLERLLDASEDLLENAHFDQLTIQRICEHAQVTVGNFYNRFPTKRALLDALYERYLDEGIHEISEFAGREWADVPLATRVRELVQTIVHLYRSRRGIVRSLSLHYRRRPGDASTVVRQRLETMVTQAERVLAACDDEVTAEDPKWAAGFAIQMIMAVAREKILFNDYPQADPTRTADDRLVADLTHAALSFLLTYRGHHE